MKNQIKNQPRSWLGIALTALALSSGCLPQQNLSTTTESVSSQMSVLPIDQTQPVNTSNGKSGDFDSAFGTKGLVKMGIGYTTSSIPVFSSAQKLILQSTGRIIAAGILRDQGGSPQSKVWVGRWNADGTPDLSFNSNIGFQYSKPCSSGTDAITFSTVLYRVTSLFELGNQIYVAGSARGESGSSQQHRTFLLRLDFAGKVSASACVNDVLGGSKGLRFAGAEAAFVASLNSGTLAVGGTACSITSTNCTSTGRVGVALYDAQSLGRISSKVLDNLQVDDDPLGFLRDFSVSISSLSTDRGKILLGGSISVSMAANYNTGNIVTEPANPNSVDLNRQGDALVIRMNDQFDLDHGFGLTQDPITHVGVRERWDALGGTINGSAAGYYFYDANFDAATPWIPYTSGTLYGSDDRISQLQVAADGSVYVGGTLWNREGNLNTQRCLLMRLTTTGLIHSSTGNQGVILSGSSQGGVPSTLTDFVSCDVRGLALQSDGKLLLSATTETQGRTLGLQQDLLVVRYTPQLTFDASFASGGKSLINLGTNQSVGESILYDSSSSRLFVSGWTCGSNLGCSSKTPYEPTANADSRNLVLLRLMP